MSQVYHWPLHSQLEHDEKGGKSLAEMEKQVQRDFSEQGIREPSVGSYQVAMAIKRGYVVPGWRLIDYVRSTWKGMEGDQLSPICICGEYVGDDKEAWIAHGWREGEPEGLGNGTVSHRRKPRKRFQLVNVWGEQGSTKSSFVAQLLGLAHQGYGEGLTDEERIKAWDWCQEITICNRDDLQKAADYLDEPGKRFDVLYLDDVNSTIGKQLAWEDRDLYRLTFNLVGMIRRNVGTLFTSLPNIQMLIGSFVNVETFEVIVYPNSTYKVERMAHDIHPYLFAKDRITKIIVDEGSFNPYDTPMYYWKKYEERTNIQGHGAIRNVIDRIGELEQETADNKKEEVKAMMRKGLRVPDNKILEAARANGLKIGQHAGQELLRVAKKMMLENSSLDEGSDV